MAKSTVEAKIIKVTRKVSGQGNAYFQVSIKEDSGIPDQNGSTIKRDWNEVYYSLKPEQKEPTYFEGRIANVTLNFYPVTRKVGDKEYTDIKVNIDDIVLVAE